MAKGSYGLWQSDLTPAMMAEELRLSDVGWDPAGKRLLWIEGRSGKNVLVMGTAAAAPRDLTVQRSARGEIGYGGGAMTALQDGAVFTSEGRIYRVRYDHGRPKALTPRYGSVASPAPSPDGHWLAYVHSDGSEDLLAVVDADGERWPQKLATGADFYMLPVWHPYGRHLAWVEWDHPNMPWDGTRLVLGTLATEDGAAPSVKARVVVAGDDDTSATEPSFSPDGRWLAYVCDADGWDDLYVRDLDTGETRRLTQGNADFGQPAWAQGMRSYAWAADSGALYAVRRCETQDALWRVPLDGAEPAPVAALNAYDHVQQPTVSAAGRLACIASSYSVGARVLVWDPVDDSVRVRARATAERLDPSTLAEPRFLTWRGDDGEDVHGLLYAPEGGPLDEHPPLVVTVHGGPTGRARRGWDSAAQFLATRGWAVLSVDYRGSAGYGRSYRNRLRGNWGLLDVEDAASGARYCAQSGLADGDRMAIMGGSAGGYTVLETLARHPGLFAAGICMYGVTDLFALLEDTHKFEAHYTDSLVGPLPDAAAAYRERSPVRHADRIADPVAIFQGEKDNVVPLSQAEAIVEALKERGVPHTYQVYEGEGHGWRKRETIANFWQEVVRFLRSYVLYA
jgi:dipeptidyl aminopeptidase/acylaminoacyl peptidase